MFQNRRFRNQAVGRETTFQNGTLPLKTGGLEHMLLKLKTDHYITIPYALAGYIL